MFPVWKVLAPIDLAIPSEAPVQHAIDVTKALGAEVTLLHVPDTSWLQRARRVGWPLNALGSQATDPDIHRLVLPGNPPDTIARYADFIEADLLLVTSRNYGTWNRLWSRSIAEEVVDATRRPVWITPSRTVNSDYQFRCRRILCCLQLDGRDSAIMNHAIEIAGRSGAELILLQILSSSRMLSRDAAMERIRELAARISIPHITSVMIGPAAKCLRLAAREHSADLVLTARGTEPVGLRSTFRLNCPLITVFSAVFESGVQGTAREDPLESEYALRDGRDRSSLPKHYRGM